MRRIVAIPVLAIGLMIALAVGSYALAGGNNPDTNKQFVKADEMTGYQEGPSISSPGVGEFTARIEDAAIVYTLTYAGLEGQAVQAHIHFAKRDENGGISVFLCGGGGKPPCPPAGGTVEGVITPADVIGPVNQGIEPGSFEELVRAIRSGNTYANVHSTRFPGGEVRGQINDQDQRDTTQR